MKKLWNKNRVLFVLGIIMAVCLVILSVTFITSVLNQDNNPYGERTLDNDKYPVDDALKQKIDEYFKKDENVISLSTELRIRTIYINIKLNEKISLDNAKKLVEKSKELFAEDYLDYYDLEYSLDSDNYTIFGKRKAKIDKFSWNNNREVEAKEDEE